MIDYRDKNKKTSLVNSYTNNYSLVSLYLKCYFSLKNCNKENNWTFAIIPVCVNK